MFLTSTLAVLALLTVALRRGGAVAGWLVEVTSSMRVWLLVAPTAPIATRLTPAAAVTTSALSPARW